MYLRLSDTEMSNLSRSRVSPISDGESDIGPRRESFNREPSSNTSSQPFVSQTINLPSSRSCSPNEHHADQNNGPSHHGDGTTTSIDPPKPQRSGSGVPPSNDSAAKNSQTANSVMNQMHVTVDRMTSALSSTAVGLHQVLLSSRAQLENTRTALSQTLQDFQVSMITESTDIDVNTNIAESRLVEQINNLQQQIDRIDNQCERLGTTLPQAYPAISAHVFTHETGIDGHGSDSFTDVQHEFITRHSNFSTALDSSMRSRKRKASFEAGLDEPRLVEAGSPDLSDS